MTNVEKVRTLTLKLSEKDAEAFMRNSYLTEFVDVNGEAALAGNVTLAEVIKHELEHTPLMDARFGETLELTSLEVNVTNVQKPKAKAKAKSWKYALMGLMLFTAGFIGIVISKYSLTAVGIPGSAIFFIKAWRSRDGSD